MIRKIKIYVDTGVSYKRLKKLMREKKIGFEIFDTNIENPTKIKKENALAIVGPTVNNYPGLNGMRLAGSKQGNNYNKICSIIGKENVGDVLHLESAINFGADYFITKDKDILEKKEQLMKEFSCMKIMSQEKFEHHLENLE